MQFIPFKKLKQKNLPVFILLKKKSFIFKLRFMEDTSYMSSPPKTMLNITLSYLIIISKHNI